MICTSNLIGHFDSREDETLTKLIIDGKAVRWFIAEEHISMVEELSSKYISHAAPFGGSVENIEKAKHYFAMSKNINLSSLKTIGCNGTATNTVHKKSVRIMEETLQKSLQVIVCLLHLNELPLRKLMVKLNGSTTDPEGFSAPVGKTAAKLQEYVSMHCKHKNLTHYCSETLNTCILPEKYVLYVSILRGIHTY